MTIYREGIAQPSPDPAVVDLLRAHEWDHRAKGCACGWTQKRVVPRGGERINHSVHVAGLIAGATR
jgi:hypothetical protein